MSDPEIPVHILGDEALRAALERAAETGDASATYIEIYASTEAHQQELIARAHFKIDPWRRAGLALIGVSAGAAFLHAVKSVFRNPWSLLWQSGWLVVLGWLARASWRRRR